MASSSDPPDLCFLDSLGLQVWATGTCEVDIFSKTKMCHCVINLPYHLIWQEPTDAGFISKEWSDILKVYNVLFSVTTVILLRITRDYLLLLFELMKNISLYRRLVSESHPISGKICMCLMKNIFISISSLSYPNLCVAWFLFLVPLFRQQK
jgi:hypothetical protein